MEDDEDIPNPDDTSCGAGDVSIDLTGAGEIAKTGRKILDFINGRKAPNRIREVANAESDARLIEAKSEAEASLIKQRSEHRLEREKMRHQYNIEKMARMAESSLNPDVNPEDIDQDWLAKWIERAKNCSDEDIQQIWAKILSGEINKPESYSIRILNFLDSISKKEAQLIATIGSYSITAGDFKCGIIYKSASVLKEIGFDLGTWNYLEEIGVLSNKISFADFSMMNLHFPVATQPNGEQCAVINNHELALILSPKDASKDVQLPADLSFTSLGADVLRLAECSGNISYMSEIGEFFKNECKRIVLVKRFGLKTGDQETAQIIKTIL